MCSNTPRHRASPSRSRLLGRLALVDVLHEHHRSGRRTAAPGVGHRHGGDAGPARRPVFGEVPELDAGDDGLAPQRPCHHEVARRDPAPVRVVPDPAFPLLGPGGGRHRLGHEAAQRRVAAHHPARAVGDAHPGREEVEHGREVRALQRHVHLRPALPRLVAHELEQAVGRPGGVGVRVAQGEHQPVGPEPRAVLALVPPLVGGAAVADRPLGLLAGRAARAVLGGEDQVGRAADDLVLPPPEQPFRALVPRGDAPVGVHAEDRVVGGARQDEAKPLLALAQHGAALGQRRVGPPQRLVVRLARREVGPARRRLAPVPRLGLGRRRARHRRVGRAPGPLAREFVPMQPADALGEEARARERPAQRRVLRLKRRDPGATGRSVRPRRGRGAASRFGGAIVHDRVA
jgi:hypothetical protein